MKSMAYKRKNNDNTVIDINSDTQPEMNSSYSFGDYAKVGLAIVGTVAGATVLANKAGFVPSSSRESDAASDNRLDNPYQLINLQETITFAGNSLSMQPRYAKRAFGGEFQINTYTTLDQRRSSVAALDTGDFVAVWQSSGQDGNLWGIYGQRFSNTSIPQGSEFQINTYTTFDQMWPSVAALDTGDFVVTWRSDGQDGNSSSIYGQRFSNSGAPQGSEFQINTNATLSQKWPSVAGLSTGGFVVTWGALSPGQDDDIYDQRYSSTGIPQGNEFQINTNITSDSHSPSVAALNSGDFVVTWHSVGQDGYGDIYGQRFSNNGAPQGSEFQINTNTASVQLFSSIAALSTGDFVVAWTSDRQDGDMFGLYGQRFLNNGVPQGSEFQINTYTTIHQRWPSVAALGTDDFVVTWESYGQDGDWYGVYGRRFSNNGVPQGSEFQINTYTTKHQRWPSVAALGTGDFVVTWTSDGQDGNGSGIYGRIYFNDASVDAPVLVNNALTINQGDTIILSTANLSATDVDSEDATLAFTVSNVQNGQFERVANPGIAVTSFTQQEIIDGAIQFVHDDSENAPAYDVSVSGDLATTTPMAAFTSVNDAPSLTLNSFILQRGEPIIITPTLLNAIDSDNSNTELTINVASSSNGYFRTATTDAAITQFTMQQIINNEIMLVSDSTTLPEYTLDVSDGALTSGSVNSAILYIAQNQLVIRPSGITSLRSTQLDIQTQIAPTDLIISIPTMAHSRFEKSNNQSTPISSFTLEELNAEEIVFMHIGATNTPRFTLSFEDISTNYTFPQIINGNAILNYPPEVINPVGTLRWPLNQLSNYTVPAILFSDPDGDRLQFSVKKLNDNALPQWVQFDNAQNILAGTPTTGGLYSFKIIASDPYNETAEDRFYLDVRSNYDTEAANPLPIVAAIAGGAAVIGGCVAAGILYFKKAQDRKTRMQHKFAQRVRHHLKLKDVDNFKSEDGQRFVQAVGTLNGLLQEEQGIDIANIDDNRLDNLARNIATAAKNKISPATVGLWKKSAITIQEFADNIEQIARDNRLDDISHAEVSDDVSIPMHTL